jgi:Peroxidase, family 2
MEQHGRYFSCSIPPLRDVLSLYKDLAKMGRRKPVPQSPSTSRKAFNMFTKGFISLLILSLGFNAYAFPPSDPGKGPGRPPLRPVSNPPPPPPPISVNGTKLVHDAAHPYRAPGPGDMRGPCPGLNTLANHGVSDPVSLNRARLT